MDNRSPDRSPLGPRRIALAGAGLFALLALVAAASRAHHVPGTSGGIHQPPRGIGNYLFSIFAVLAVAATLALLYLWFSERDLFVQARKKRESRGMYKAIFILLLIGLVAAVVARIWGVHPLFGHSRLGRSLIGPRAPTSPAQHPHGQPTPPTFEWLPVVVATAAGLALLGYIGLRRLKRVRRGLLDRHLLEQQLEALLDDTLDDLYANADPRSAILAAYSRMEQLFASSGLPRHPHEAPLEYLGRAVGDLTSSGAALGRLTGLFQWARFSSHGVDETMRTEAITALTQVRDELRAKREEDKLRRKQSEEFQREQLNRQGDAPPGEDPFAAAAAKARGSLHGRRGF
ncbi:MAG: DUF4129 domain-containing protein [Gaiellaceae bacterium]